MILERSKKSKSGYKGVWQKGDNSFVARHGGNMIGSFHSASEAAMAYYRYKKKNRRGEIHKRPLTVPGQLGSKRVVLRDNGVLKDALSAQRERLPSSENGIQLIRSNSFSGYHMVNVQAGARRQMLDKKSFHLPSVKPFYVEAQTSSGKHFLGSFETNVAAAVCVAEFLGEQKKPQPKNPGEQSVTELRHSTRHLGRAEKTYTEEEDDEACVIAKDDNSNSACVHWVQCDLCNKWRKIPGLDGIGESWICAMNPDSLYNDCALLEEEDLAQDGSNGGAANPAPVSASVFAPASTSIPADQTILEKLEVLKVEFGYRDEGWTAIEIVNNVAALTGISVQGNLRTRLDILYNELKPT